MKTLRPGTPGYRLVIVLFCFVLCLSLVGLPSRAFAVPPDPMETPNTEQVAPADPEILQPQQPTSSVDNIPRIGMEILRNRLDPIISEGTSPDEWNQLRELSEKGLKFVRFTINWGEIQPNDFGVCYDELPTRPECWGNYPDTIRNLKRLGIEPMLTIHLVPAWAGPASPTPWAEPIYDNLTVQNKFISFVAEAARYFSQPAYDIRYWEFWNEPDLLDWTMPKPGSSGGGGGVGGGGGPPGHGDPTPEPMRSEKGGPPSRTSSARIISDPSAPCPTYKTGSAQEYGGLMNRFNVAVKGQYPTDHQPVVMNGGLAYDYFTCENNSILHPSSVGFLNETLSLSPGHPNRFDTWVDIFAFHYYPTYTWRSINDKISYLRTLTNGSITKPGYATKQGDAVFNPTPVTNNKGKTDRLPR